jgi:uracil-DNA glycosylase
VDARERLRAYLEQRRELGETELVLDALSTDDVLRMVGAIPAGDSVPRATPRPVAAPIAQPDAPLPTPGARDADASTPPRSTEVSPPRPVDPAIDRALEAGGDWRAVVAAAGGAPPRGHVPPPPPSTPEPAAAATSPTPTDASQSRPRWRVVGVEYTPGLRVERPPLLAAEPAWPSLDAVTSAIAGCRACALHSTATKHVPGVGNPTADVMVVGEAPGEQEDLQGEPFVGPAGQLLTKILGAINLPREQVFICNVLKHRPPGNRNPLPDEVRACAPFLQAQIDLVQPRMLLAFGTFAAQSLLNTKLAIGKLRQQVHAYQGIPLVATYHPAALLRNDAWKRPTWDDMKLARRILDATVRA